MPPGRPPGSKTKRGWNRVTARAERAAYVDYITDNGAFVADKMRKIGADDQHPGQIQALRWLAEHTSAGKVPDAVELDVTQHTEVTIDYSALTLEQAVQWRELTRAATKALPEPEPEPADDAEIVDDE